MSPLPFSSPTPSPQDDLLIIQQQEELLHFAAFDAETAWRLGSALRNRLLRTPPGGTVEIEARGLLLFACATDGAKPNQAHWIRRKRNTVHQLKRSSYGVGRQLAANNQTLLDAHHLDEKDYAAHGGGFPIIVLHEGPIGTVVLSGLPQRDDHGLVIDALAEVLAIDAPRLR
jgi:uncharacterized protein (UPF0303 family)